MPRQLLQGETQLLPIGGVPGLSLHDLLECAHRDLEAAGSERSGSPPEQGPDTATLESLNQRVRKGRLRLASKRQVLPGFVHLSQTPVGQPQEIVDHRGAGLESQGSIQVIHRVLVSLIRVGHPTQTVESCRRGGIQCQGPAKDRLRFHRTIGFEEDFPQSQVRWQIRGHDFDGLAQGGLRPGQIPGFLGHYTTVVRPHGSLHIQPMGVLETSPCRVPEPVGQKCPPQLTEALCQLPIADPFPPPARLQLRLLRLDLVTHRRLHAVRHHVGDGNESGGGGGY